MTAIPINVTVTDSAGASASTTVTANVSTTGTAQYPTLLNSYSVKPTFSVVGVNTQAGTAVTSFKNPSTISMAGVSISGKTINISGSNVSIDSYDLTGWQINVTGSAGNVTISNNKVIGTNAGNDLITLSNTGSVSVLNNLLDGGAALSGASGAYGIQQHIMWVAGNLSSLTVTGNYFTNMFNDGIDLVGNSLGTININGNLFDKWGTGPTHGDCIQTFSVDSTNQSIAALNVLNNTCYLPASWTAATEDNSFIRTGNNGSGKYNNTHVAFNTCVFPTGARPCASIFQLTNDSPGPGLINTWVHDNYFDDTAIEYADIDPNIAGYNYGKVTNSCTYNIWRMNTGAKLLLGQYSNHPSGGGPAAAPSVPIINTATVASGKVTLSGTGPAGQISIFVDAVLTAAATASASGAWSFTSASLASGSHTFTARAVDAFANASNESAGKTVIV